MYTYMHTIYIPTEPIAIPKLTSLSWVTKIVKVENHNDHPFHLVKQLLKYILNIFFLLNR